MGLIRTSDGAIAATYDYTPFGVTTHDNTSVATTNRFRFASGEQDATGLYYFRNRYYDPELRRWISEDPIGLSGGINLYAYVGNDPVNSWDPWGLQDDPCTWADVENPEDPDCAILVGAIIATALQVLDWTSGWSTPISPRGYGPGAFGSRSPGSPYGGNRGTRAGRPQPAAPTPSLTETCYQDLAQFGTNAAFHALGLGWWNAFKAVRTATSVSAVAGEAAVMQAGYSAIAPLSLTPPVWGLRQHARSLGGTDYGFQGGWAFVYQLGKAAPVLGVGLDLGEALVSCTAALR